jgi:hypothetical protein
VDDIECRSSKLDSLRNGKAHLVRGVEVHCPVSNGFASSPQARILADLLQTCTAVKAVSIDDEELRPTVEACLPFWSKLVDLKVGSLAGGNLVEIASLERLQLGSLQFSLDTDTCPPPVCHLAELTLIPDHTLTSSAFSFLVAASSDSLSVLDMHLDRNTPSFDLSPLNGLQYLDISIFADYDDGGVEHCRTLIKMLRSATPSLESLSLVSVDAWYFDEEIPVAQDILSALPRDLKNLSLEYFIPLRIAYLHSHLRQPALLPSLASMECLLEPCENEDDDDKRLEFRTM